MSDSWFSSSESEPAITMPLETESHNDSGISTVGPINSAGIPGTDEDSTGSNPG